MRERTKIFLVGFLAGVFSLVLGFSLGIVRAVYLIRDSMWETMPKGVEFLLEGISLVLIGELYQILGVALMIFGLGSICIGIKMLFKKQ